MQRVRRDDGKNTELYIFLFSIEHWLLSALSTATIVICANYVVLVCNSHFINM